MTKRLLIHLYLIILIKCQIFFITAEVISDPTTINQLTENKNIYKQIIGCPDLYSINNNFTYTNLTKISCLCSNSNKEELGVSINCIYGTTLDDLERVLKLAKIDKIPVHKVIYFFFFIK